MTLTNLTDPVIAMVGAGAVGGYYGARLAQNGLAVHFLLRTDYPAVKRYGFIVKSCAGDFILPADQVHAYDNPVRMPRADLVIVTLKTTANHCFGELIAPLLHDETMILTLQNGLGNEEELASLFGRQRILGGVAFVCINRLRPGVIAHTAHGLIRIGEFAPAGSPTPGITPRVSRLAGLFSAHGVPCEILPDLRHGRWQKLLWNIPFNGLTALLDKTTDLLLDSSSGEELLRRLMAEVVAAAAVDGVRLPVELIQKQIDNTREMGAYRTSSHIDRQENRRLELESLFGKPLKAAQAGGAQVPCMEVLYHLLSIVDRGK